MRKTAAYFISIIFLFYSGLSLLHPSYETLAAWMGPLLGSHIYTILVIFTLFVIDPMRNIAVGLVWLVAGLLIGVISRKKLGGAITAFLVWFTMIPLLFASIFGVYTNIMDRGLTEIETSEVIEIIPVLPDQLNIESFFEIPIFSDLALQAMEMASSMDESVDPMGLVWDMAMQFVVPILLKPVLIILGAIAGAIIGVTVLDKMDIKLPTRKTGVVAIIMLIVISQGLAAPLAHGIDYDDGLYLEVLGGYIESEGRAITGQVLLGSEVEVISPGASALEDLVVSLVITQKIFDPGVLYSLPLPNIEHMVPIAKVLPNTFAVTVYAEQDLSIVEARSEQVVSEFEAVYGIEFSKIISNSVSFEENEEGSLPPMTFTVYYSMNTFEETVESINAGFDEMGGFVDTVEERLDGENKDIELYVAGMITPEYFQAMLPLDDVPFGFEEPFEAVFGHTFSVLAGIQMTKDGATSNGDTLDLRDLLEISTPSYAADSDISAILVSRDNYTGTSEVLDPDTKLKLSLPADSPELMLLSMVLPMLGVIDIDSGPPNSIDLRIEAPGINVPDVSLEKTVQRDGDTSTYTVTATNNGANAIENLEIRDSFPTKYGILESGTNQASQNRLSPGESVSITYSTLVSSPGVYTEIPALMTWDGEVLPSATASNILETLTKSPNGFSLLADTYGAMKAFGDLAFDGRGNLFDVALIGFVSLIALIDVFRYIRGRSKSEPEAPEEPYLPDPPEFGDTPGDPL